MEVYFSITGFNFPTEVSGAYFDLHGFLFPLGTPTSRFPIHTFIIGEFSNTATIDGRF